MRSLKQKEHLLISRDRSSNYPFIIPYLEIMNRILEVKNMNRRILEWNASHNLDIFEIVEFSVVVKSIPHKR